MWNKLKQRQSKIVMFYQQGQRKDFLIIGYCHPKNKCIYGFKVLGVCLSAMLTLLSTKFQVVLLTLPWVHCMMFELREHHQSTHADAHMICLLLGWSTPSVFVLTCPYCWQLTLSAKNNWAESDVMVLQWFHLNCIHLSCFIKAEFPNILYFCE